jgi:hypothetical protein
MSECAGSFRALKELLTTALILAHPNPNLDFILDTDASAFAIGAVLSQVTEDGTEQVLGYGSRTLNKMERRYATTKRELLVAL